MRQSFWNMVFRKAIRDTRRTFGLADAASLVLASIAIIAALFLVAYVGSSDDLKAQLLDLASKALYLAIAVPVVFIWKLVKAPENILSIGNPPVFNGALR